MKILLVPDRPGWAFDHRANDLQSLGLRGIQLYKKFPSDVRAEDQTRYDLIYPMSVSLARRLRDVGIPLNKMAAGITSLRLFERELTADGGFRPRFLAFLRQLRGIHAWTDEIVDLFKPYCPIVKTRIGIHAQRFKPAGDRRTNDVFTVGWAGRIDDPRSRELKGYDIVVEALSGLNVKLDIRTYKENYVPRAQMVPFYQGLDCFICSSRSEGLPNPVMEAASCGVPVITTRVGIVPELIKHGRNGLIVQREASAIRTQVKRLMHDPAKGATLGRNIRQTIERGWTWKICKADWEAFFQSLK